ncbi:SRPBCC family protein [Caballeronia novacaledonica]|jgi:carbon monoxide dehydrogenase subunit G|uniref:SRPBCC family protein n=1 Tax=Caballeronia novacaledonica TaxID=1544861 RepID=A0AA37IEA8_9BURK|nr:SRPBCC family protein [Caballeronia novacaledonica]GJH25136.1 SRPBCC family protein [Caballeronia novacaledonica]
MAITIRSSFTVDAPPADVWKTMIDIERSAPCFPGAELKEQQPDGSYKGGFTVKLGPLTLKFAGKFKIADQNDADRTVVVSASGTDTKGRGGADAQINAAVAEAGGKTKVDVVSEVNLSGTVAQYGRGAGMIEALSQQLLNQFAKNLTALIEADAAHDEQPTHTLVGAAVPNDTAASAAPQDAPNAQNAQAARETAAPVPPAAPRRPPPPPVAPLDAGALMRKAMWQSIRNFFARLFRPGQQH